MQKINGRPAFIAFRRHIVQAIIRLANKHEGGTWELVSVDEAPDVTAIEFELDYPIRDVYKGHVNQHAANLLGARPNQSRTERPSS